MNPITLAPTEQEVRWRSFKEKVLLPAIVEMSIVNTPNAHTWKGGYDYDVGGARIIHIHNTRSCGWDYLPYSSYARPLFDFSTTVNHYHQRVERNDRAHSREENNHNRRDNTALVVAVVAACFFACIYTCYQMAHSIGQYMSSSKSTKEMAAEHASIKNLTGLSADQLKCINEVVGFRSMYLETSHQRSFNEIVQDVAIIGGLSLIAYGAIAGFSSALLVAGAVTVAAALIFKIVTPYRYPGLDTDEKRHQSYYIIEKAKTLYKEELKILVVKTEPHPPSEPYPLYPNLSDLAQNLGQFYHVEPKDIGFLPSSTLPQNDWYVFPSAPGIDE